MFGVHCCSLLLLAVVCIELLSFAILILDIGLLRRLRLGEVLYVAGENGRNKTGPKPIGLNKEK